MTCGRLCAVEKDGCVQPDANYLSYWTRVLMLEHVPDKFAAASAREVEVRRRRQWTDSSCRSTAVLLSRGGAAVLPGRSVRGLL